MADVLEISFDAQGRQIETWRPETADEAAERQALAQIEDAARANLALAAAAALRAKRDRYLAQTDYIGTYIASGIPGDLPAPLAEAIRANADAWLAYRQALRDYMENVSDPLTPPPLPSPPAAPRLTFT